MDRESARGSPGGSEEPGAPHFPPVSQPREPCLQTGSWRQSKDGGADTPRVPLPLPPGAPPRTPWQACCGRECLENQERGDGGTSESWGLCEEEELGKVVP